MTTKTITKYETVEKEREVILLLNSMQKFFTLLLVRGRQGES